MMQAGRALDLWLHRRMSGDALEGYEWPKGGAGDSVVCVRENGVRRVIIPRYSTTYEGMGAVIEAMRGRLWFSTHTDLSLDTGTEWWSWHFTFHATPHLSGSAQAETAPYAVALAAKAALEAQQHA